MIPHPLTLLVCWLIGAGLSSGLGYIVGFVGELCVDAERYGVLSPRAFAAVFVALGWFSSLAGAFFTGAAMRLWADKPWPKAVIWSVITILLVGALNSAGLSLLGSPRFWLLTPLGCALGAIAAERFESDPRVAAVRDGVRRMIVWEN